MASLWASPRLAGMLLSLMFLESSSNYLLTIFFKRVEWNLEQWALVLSLRLKRCTSSLILENQNASVPDRHITSEPFIVNEVNELVDFQQKSEIPAWSANQTLRKLLTVSFGHSSLRCCRQNVWKNSNSGSGLVFSPFIIFMESFK